MSPMSGSLTQAAFDASFQQNLSVMKLFPGHPATAGHPPPPSTSASPSGTLLRPPASGLQSPSLPQTYPADFSNYGPMYSSYYAKQAQQAMVAGQARGSPYQRSMYSPTPCYQGGAVPYQGAAGGPGPPALYPRQYEYPMHTPR